MIRCLPRCINNILLQGMPLVKPKYLPAHFQLFITNTNQEYAYTYPYL